MAAPHTRRDPDPAPGLIDDHRHHPDLFLPGQMNELPAGADGKQSVYPRFDLEIDHPPQFRFIHGAVGGKGG